MTLGRTLSQTFFLAGSGSGRAALLSTAPNWRLCFRTVDTTGARPARWVAPGFGVTVIALASPYPAAAVVIIKENIDQQLAHALVQEAMSGLLQSVGNKLRFADALRGQRCGRSQ